MATPTTVAPVVTNPGGTGTTITPTLPSGHAAGDVIEIFIGNSGVTTWSAPAGWTIKQQTPSSGNASSGVVGTILFRRVLSGDTLPLASPVCSLGATVTRGAIAFVKRGADVEGVHTLFEWLAFGSATANSNPIRPPSVTTRSPENLITHYYVQRSATNTPEPTGYTQVQQIVVGTIAINVAEKNVADQNTVLSNQDASPTSGVRWVGMISCTPSPDYPYYRSGSQAFNANGTSVTPALPTGTTASDNRGNKDLIVLTAQCAGADPTLNTPGDWTPLPDWSNTTSGGATTVRKWWRLYNGSGDRQVNCTPSGEIFAYLSVYHNAHQSIATGTSAVQQNASSTTSTFPALPRTGTKATIQATCVADTTPTFTAPSGWTERNDSQGVTCADQSFDATGTTASDSFTLSSASPTLAGLMEVFSVASVINLILTPGNATLTLTTFAPTVAVGANETVTPAAASLTLTTFAPVVTSTQPFPQTGQLDDFNRTDGSLGANWDGKLFNADSLLAIDTNRVKGVNAGANNNQAWATQLGPDCEAWVEIATGSSDENSTFLAARWSAVDTDTPNGYAVRARGGATNNVAIFRFDAGAVTGLGSVSQVIGDGDWLGVRVIGTTISLYYKDLSGSNQWELLLEATDATYTAAGFIGLFIGGGTLRADNFGGGTLGPVTVTPDIASLALTGFAPVLQLSLTPTTTTLSLTTFTPSVTITDHLTVTPANASLTLTGFTPTIINTTPAYRDSVATSETTGTGNPTATITPEVGDLLVVYCFVAENTNDTPTCSDDNGGSYDLVDVVTAIITSDYRLSVFIRTELIPNTNETTVTVATGSNTSRIIHLYAIKNMQRAGMSAVRSRGEENNQSGTPAPTLDQSALATNIVLIATASSDSSSLVPAGWTARQETFASAPPAALLSGSRDNGFTGTTITFQGEQSANFSSHALELNTAAPGETVTPASVTLITTAFAPSLQLSVTPENESLVVTTFAPVLQTAFSPASTNLTLTTFAPSVTVQVTVPSAALTLTTFTPTVIANVTVTPATASFVLTLFTAQLQEVVSPAAQSLTLTTFAPTLALAITPSSAQLALTGNAPQLREAITPNVASLLLTAFAPAVTTTANVTVEPTPALLTLTGFAPALHEQVTPAVGTFTLTTFAPEVTTSADITVSPAAATLTLTTFTPALQLVITPAASALSLSTFAPTITVSADRVETPASASLILTTFAPELRLMVTPTTATLSLSTNAPVLGLVVQPANGSLVLSTFAPSLTVDIVITPTQASLVLTGFPPTVTTGALVTTVTPAPATLTLTGYAPWLFLGLVPANRTYMVESGVYEVVISAGDHELVED